MRRILLAAFFILIPFCIQAQKIEKNYYDEFTGDRVMYTNLQKLDVKGRNEKIGNEMRLRFVLNDDYQYMVLHWVSKNFLEVAADAKIQFKFDNGVILELLNERSTQATQGGAGFSKKGVGVMLNCLGDIPAFATALVTTIRIYTSEGFYDFDVNPKDGKKIHKMYMLFNKEVYQGR